MLFKKTAKYLNNLSKFVSEDTLNLVIYESLKNYSFLFEKKKMFGSLKKKSFFFFGKRGRTNSFFLKKGKEKKKIEKKKKIGIRA